MICGSGIQEGLQVALAEAAGLDTPHPTCGRGPHKVVNSRSHVFWEGEHLWKLSLTLIILTKVENDCWDYLYTFFHLRFHEPNWYLLNGQQNAFTNTRASTSQAFSVLFLLAHFNFFPRIWKQHALPTSDTFAIYKSISVISPLISLCVLEYELSSYLKFKYCPGLPSNMSNFEDKSQWRFLLFGFVATDIRNRLCK